MNNKDDKKPFDKKLIIGISIATVVVLVMTALVGGSLLKNFDKADSEAKNGSQIIENTNGNGDNDKEEIKEEKPKEEENKITEAAVSVPENQQVQTENTNIGAKPTEEPSKKPVVVPDQLPEGEAYAVYNNTLIVGDSRTEGFKLYSGVKNASYFCMKAMTIDKIVQGKTANVGGRNISVYDMLDAATYDKVIVCVGLNELGWNHIETFLADYGTLIDNIKDKQPNAIIYLQAVLPVSREKNDSDKVHNNAQIFWYNENIIELAESKGVQYVNPAEALVDEEGFLVGEATTDGVHLNSAYCKVWAAYLAQLIK